MSYNSHFYSYLCDRASSAWRLNTDQNVSSVPSSQTVSGLPSAAILYIAQHPSKHGCSNTVKTVMYGKYNSLTLTDSNSNKDIRSISFHPPIHSNWSVSPMLSPPGAPPYARLISSPHFDPSSYRSFPHRYYFIVDPLPNLILKRSACVSVCFWWSDLSADKVKPNLIVP